MEPARTEHPKSIERDGVGTSPAGTQAAGTQPAQTQPTQTQPVGSRPVTDRSASSVPLARIQDQVRQYWGFDSLRPLQEEAIRATLDGRDSVVVMPTGGGKSLCYQVPPLLTDSTDVVVSPLIALMKDQVDGLRACGYPAAAIHSGLTEAEKDTAFNDLRAGKLRLIFVSPERLLMPGFMNTLDRLNVRSFAIDEAHCISHWGHDFRPEYRRVSALKQRFPKTSVHAYTATATKRVRQDIAAQLHLADPVMLVGTFDRANLVYRVVPRVDVYAQTVEVLKRHHGEGAIVYCLSRKDTEAMADTLAGVGIDARAYHAGLSQEERRRTQDAFASESLNVVAATVAFGMGIDRSNVRCVVHATMPKSVEHYQQEAGRAGRDGLEAECVLLYSAADAMRWQSLLARGVEDSPAGADFLAAQMSLLDEMRRYCTTPQCRHRALTEHFDQVYSKGDCEACDICLDETEGFEDATETARKILACVARIERNGDLSYGVTHLTDVLLGADTEGVRRAGHHDLSTYGLLKGSPRKALTNWIYQLVDQGLVTRTSGKHPVLLLNDASWEVMRGERPVRLIQASVKPVKATRGSVEDWAGVDRDLFEHLRGVRFELAKQQGVPAYVVFGDRTLRELARLRPTNAEALKGVSGVGKVKLARFGKRFLGEIDSFCAANGIATDVGGGACVEDEPVAETRALPRGAGRVSAAKRAALDLFARGTSLGEVVERTGRSHGAVVKYLCEFIEDTRPASVGRWVSDETYEKVAAVAGELGTARLRPIFERLDEKVPYDEIRLVAIHLDVRDD